MSILPVCSGICTFSSLTMTFSPWRTGSLTQKPTRCLSSAIAACRMMQHRKRRSPNKTEHRRTVGTVKDICTHTNINIAKPQFSAGSESFRSVLRTLDSFPVKDVVVLRCDCKSFCRSYFLLALLFCGQSRRTWLSWNEHLFFLSFFPLWGNWFNLQTQMSGREGGWSVGHIVGKKETHRKPLKFCSLVLLFR